MKVKQLKINSFRGISELTLDFDLNEPTVFVGINGAGKSSILDCLAILLSWFTARVQNPQGSGSYFSDSDINNKSKETHNKITAYTSNLQDISWSLTKVKKGYKKETNTNLSGIKQLADHIKCHHLANHRAPLPLAVYYPTNRAVLDVPLRIKQKHLFEPINSYDLALTKGKIDFRRFFEWFRNREDLENENYKYHPEQGQDKQLEAVRTAIYQILEGFSNLRVERSPLQMTLEKEGQKLIVNQLSDGEKCLLAMVGDLARRLAIANPYSQDVLKEEAIVLIDEIELHLHPKWQRDIISALKRTFPECQFIVTTHSPQVLSHIKPQNIYLLEKNTEGIIFRKPKSSFGRDSNSILEDIMEVSERPQEIKEDILNLFQLIDEGNLGKAQELRQKIAHKIGSDEPELIKAGTSIRRREILNR
ncbi:putative ATP-binding protein involved in virulence [Xenococcus sp. PCC 7305]|uniref:AAA family ATPase n=1 Tax=Xenococcus sp. PCC 7305 TaxID=102125 RepID=UPI0002AC8147|nr:AAA family ATPase [Xenococcus sp. PCC 7305]ELS02840.1 putative ATP-binding protein involved in virulence [Xenococcus sp. PCC 7305]